MCSSVISPDLTAETIAECAAVRSLGMSSMSHPAETALTLAAAAVYSSVIALMESESVIVTPEKLSSPRSHPDTTSDESEDGDFSVVQFGDACEIITKSAPACMPEMKG